MSFGILPFRSELCGIVIFAEGDAHTYVSDEHAALSLLLHTLGSDLDCYGEAFGLEETLNLAFLQHHFPQHPQEDVQYFSKSAKSLIACVGSSLPALAHQSSDVQFIRLSRETLANRLFGSDERVRHASSIFRQAIVVPLDGFGTAVFYLKTLDLAVGMRSYMTHMQTSALHLAQAIAQRRSFLLVRLRVLRNFRVLGIALAFFLPLFLRWVSRTGRMHALPMQPAECISLPTKKVKLKNAIKLWLAQYFAKWAGQAPNMPARLTTLQSLVALVSAFAFIGGVQLIFNAINSTNWTADGLADPFSLPPSFGALATLLYILPTAPSSQPRIVVFAHLLAVGVSSAISFAFGRGLLVWLQQALTACLTIAIMGRVGIPHPPAFLGC
eukprot:EG_transcript_7862